MADFIHTEENIRKLFPTGSLFNYLGHQYKVILSGKPRPDGGGECKTDVYVRAKDTTTHDETEFKISVKQPNAEFLENHILLERAKQILGQDAQSIIYSSLTKAEIKQSFENACLIKKTGKNTTGPVFVLGWRLDLFNKASKTKAGCFTMTEEQKLDVYAGINLSREKKDSRIDGNIVINSGIANFYLIVPDKGISTANECMNHLVKMDEYIKTAEIFYSCRAVTYRIAEGKWDGPRGLAVVVNWSTNGNKLHASLNFQKPLSTNATESKNALVPCLNKLGLTRTSSYDDIKNALDKSVIIKE